MRLIEARRDRYRKLAKELGYRSRAAFKLIQADRKYHIFRRGQVVLDLGSAPGGWLQVASKAVGEEGLVVGVDLKKVEFLAKNVVVIQRDIYDEALAADLLKISSSGYDVVLSDLSPNTSGIWELDHNRQIDMTERVLDLSSILLRKNGSLFMKVFDGERFKDIIRKARTCFLSVSTIKPEASRKQSSEVYVYCDGFVASRTASRTSL